VRFDAEFDKFLNDVVNLSPARLKLLRERVETIEGVLRGADADALVVVDARPQGSLAHRTIINPSDPQRGFDADLLVEVEDRFATPRDLLKAVEDVLCASKRHADLIHTKTRCVTVEYQGEFHIDVVPCVRRGGTLYIGNKDTGGWEATDPDGYTMWLRQRDDYARGHLVPTIRLCKYLRDYKGRPKIKSVILATELARRVEQTSSFGRSDDYESLSTTFVLLLEDLADWAKQFTEAPYLTEPTCNAELRLDDTNWSAFTKQIRSLATRARTAYDEPDEQRSLGLWRELLSERFPAPAARTVEAALVPGEQDLYRDRSIPTAISNTVTINARMRPTDGSPGGDLTDFGHLPKGRGLEFTITTPVAEPFDVYWKVKNTGAEAQARRALRGEISRDDQNPGRSAYRTESTAYSGNHYVEAYIVKDNVCVAKYRQPVVIA
jgi:hypothetical protein